MRYYYYGSDTDIKKEDMGKRGLSRRNGRAGRYPESRPEAWYREAYQNGWEDGLVIEEDTIYEIDRECLKCRNQHRS